MLIVPCNNTQCSKHCIAAYDSNNYYQIFPDCVSVQTFYACMATGLMYIMMPSALIVLVIAAYLYTCLHFDVL